MSIGAVHNRERIAVVFAKPILQLRIGQIAGKRIVVTGFACYATAIVSYRTEHEKSDSDE